MIEQKHGDISVTLFLSDVKIFEKLSEAVYFIETIDMFFVEVYEKSPMSITVSAEYHNPCFLVESIARTSNTAELLRHKVGWPVAMLTLSI